MRENCPRQVRSSRFGRVKSLLFTAAITTAAAFSLIGCDRREARAPSAVEATSPQGRIVERSAAAFKRMRENPRFAEMGSYLSRARAVMIFPRVIKASAIIGGEGGNGVMVVRKPDGAWSEPAFYGLGAPSVGLQIGYQETTVVLFIMDDTTLERAYNSTLTLGTHAGVALGNVIDPNGKAGSAMAPHVYQVAESGGVYAGVSLDGYVIDSREGHNVAYYGSDATVRRILIDGAEHRRENDVLKLAMRGGA